MWSPPIRCGVTSVSLVTLSFVISFLSVQTVAAPLSNEPVIYFDLVRWENRTFSPRLFYLMLISSRNDKQAKHNLVHLDCCAEGSDLPLHNANQIGAKPYVGFRHGSSKGGNHPASGSDAAKTSHTAIVSTRKGLDEPAAVVTSGSVEDFIQYDDENGPEAAISFDGPSPSQAENNPIFFESADRPRIDNEANHRRDDKHNINGESADRASFPTYDGIDLERHNRICRQKTRGRSRDRSYASGELQGGLNTMDFTFKLVHKSIEEPGNIVFSPVSIINVLTLLLLGARGNSHYELAKLLGVAEKSSRNETLRSKDIKFHTGFSDALYALLRCRSDVLLESANKLFTHVNYPLSPDYSSFAKSYYDAEIESYDFENGIDFPDVVNAWVEKNTRGQIKSIIDHPPSPLTTLVMLNALYFKGEWELPFETKLTRSGLFHTYQNVTIPVQMMTNQLTIPHITTECYDMIRIPYYGSDTSMFVILPMEEGFDYLKKVERELTASIIQENINHLSGVYPPPKLVTVKLPKMRVECQSHLKSLLEDIGLKTVFKDNSANFSNISPKAGLYVNSLLHKAVIDIDEHGSEASAVSFATVDRIIDRNPILFNANRPFIFFIYNHFANLTLFWARVTDPLALDHVLQHD